MAQKNVQTRAAGIIDSLDDPEKLLAIQSNPGHIANRAVVAANVIKTLQQKAAQLNISFDIHLFEHSKLSLL